MPTLTELAAELGIPVETLNAKPDVVAKWNGHFTDAEAKLTQAAQLKREADATQALIDQNIASFGNVEATNVQLQAQIEAIKAASKTLEEKGGIKLDLNLPNLNAPAPKDAAKELLDTLTRGFSTVGQTMNEMNRYMRVFGKPLPEDPATLADRASAARLSVHDYVEQTYKVSAEETRLSTERAQKEKDDYAALKVKEYQDAHPSTSGHPELNGGFPSNHPLMPKTMDTGDFKKFSNQSAREKVAAMVGRAQERLSQAAN
jgi:hypothetical protein